MMSGWVELLREMSPRPVATGDVTAPLCYSAKSGPLQLRLTLLADGPQVRISGPTTSQFAATELRFLSREQVHGLPSLETGDAEFDRAVAVVSPNEASLARFSAEARESAQAVVARGGWGTGIEVVYPASAAASVDVHQARAALAAGWGALEALNAPLDALPDVAFADPAPRVRASARAVLREWAQAVSAGALLDALARHQPEDVAEWLGCIEPSSAVEFSQWGAALGDSWNPRITHAAVAILRQPWAAGSVAARGLAQRVVAAAEDEHEAYPWSEWLVEVPELMDACLDSDTRASARILSMVPLPRLSELDLLRTMNRQAGSPNGVSEKQWDEWLEHSSPAVREQATKSFAQMLALHLRRGDADGALTRVADRSSRVRALLDACLATDSPASRRVLARISPGVTEPHATRTLAQALRDRLEADDQRGAGRLMKRFADADTRLSVLIHATTSDHARTRRWATDQILRGRSPSQEDLLLLAESTSERRRLSAHFLTLLANEKAEVSAVRALGVVGDLGALPELEKRVGFFANPAIKQLASEAIAAIRARVDTSAAGGLSVDDSAHGGLSEPV